MIRLNETGEVAGVTVGLLGRDAPDRDIEIGYVLAREDGAGDLLLKLLRENEQRRYSQFQPSADSGLYRSGQCSLQQGAGENAVSPETEMESVAQTESLRWNYMFERFFQFSIFLKYKILYINYSRQKTCLFWVSQCRKQEPGGPGKWFFAQMSRRRFAQILHRKLVNLMEANEITYLIRGAAFRVHAALGPGLLESVYEAALKYELQRDGLRVRNQVGIPMIG
jgi:hypothetical protein